MEISEDKKKFIEKLKSQRSKPMLHGEQRWVTLSHNGVIFTPPYQPHGVKMLYDGEPVYLTPDQEEVATMYAKMLDTDYVKKKVFNRNFFNDWRKFLGKNHVIQDLKKCDFTPIYELHLKEKEKKKQMSVEERKALKQERLKQEQKYMWAMVDGVKTKVVNYRIEPPGLFRGRSGHPMAGKFRRRVYPSDIIINIGKDAPVPECPVPGQSWKEVRHDNTVSWLASWQDIINPEQFKHVFVCRHEATKLKGSNDEAFEFELVDKMEVDQCSADNGKVDGWSDTVWRCCSCLATLKL